MTNPFVTLAGDAIRDGKTVALAASCLNGWTEIGSIREHESGLIHIVLDAQARPDVYLPAGSVSGLRILG